jgi:hypothetical protein
MPIDYRVCFDCVKAGHKADINKAACEPTFTARALDRY